MYQKKRKRKGKNGERNRIKNNQEKLKIHVAWKFEYHRSYNLPFFLLPIIIDWPSSYRRRIASLSTERNKRKGKK